jgi:hypothetical protein
VPLQIGEKLVTDRYRDLKLQLDSVIALARVCRPAGFSLVCADSDRDIESAAIDLLSRTVSHPDDEKSKKIISESASELVEVLMDNPNNEILNFTRRFRKTNSESTIITQSLSNEEFVYSLEKLVEHFGIDNVADKVIDGLESLDVSKLDEGLTARFEALKKDALNVAKNT